MHNTRRLIATIFVLVLLVSPGFCADDQPEAEQQDLPILDVCLIDGSVIKARPPASFLVLRSPILGRLTIPWKHVLRTAPIGDDDQIDVFLVNGDHVIGSPIPLRFQISTNFGNFWVIWRQVTAMVNPNNGIDAWVIHGKHPEHGYRTDLVKDLPNYLANQLERRTLRISTMGPANSRGGPDHWLYHTGDGAENPHIFTRDGFIWYPIWGTWRQHLGSNWRYLDENHLSIGERVPWAAHQETIIEYYLVPSNPE